MINTVKAMTIEIDENNSMIEMNITEAQAKLREIVQKVNDEDERVIITENAQQKAVIISVEAFAFLHGIIEKFEAEIDEAEAHKRLSNPQEIPLPFKPAK